jgi:hypothetical protein
LQIRLLLEHWEQHSIRERASKCPLAGRAVARSNIQKKRGHMSVRATFKGRP